MSDFGSLCREIRKARVSSGLYLLRSMLCPSAVEIGGTLLRVDPARMSSQLIKGLYHGDYEAPEQAIVRAILRSTDRVLEAGAGIGLISLTAARIVGPESVVCYEPGEQAFHLLVNNAEVNDLPIRICKRALAPKSGKITFYGHDNIVSSSLIKRPGSVSSTIEADAIADVVAECRPNVLILDVEGAEVDLIRACPLEQIDKIVMEVHPNIVGDEAISSLCAHLIGAHFSLRTDLSYGDVLTFLRAARKAVNSFSH